MSIVRVKHYDSQGYAKVDPYCLYAAFAPLGDGSSFIKVGVSLSPLERIYNIHCGSPVAVEVALWTYVGSKSLAVGAEKRILHTLNQFQARGEWLRMELSSKEHKGLFHSACKAAFAKTTGRLLTWRQTTIKEIREVIDIKGFGKVRKSW